MIETKFKFKKNIQYPKRVNKIQRVSDISFKAVRSRRQKIATDTEEPGVVVSFLALTLRELDIQRRKVSTDVSRPWLQRKPQENMMSGAFMGFVF